MSYVSRRYTVPQSMVYRMPVYLMRLVHELERDTKDMKVDWNTFQMHLFPETFQGDEGNREQVTEIRMSVEVDT